MSVRVGYYVHHHGKGHLSRALTIAQHLSDVTLLGTNLAGSCGDTPYIELPDDRDCSAQGSEETPNALHYAPLHCDGIRRRAAALTAWIASYRPDLLVVDVSVEVAMLARLAATPVLYVRLAGNRVDPAHLDAFRGAQALMAPFHQTLDTLKIPPWVREKTKYICGLTNPLPALTAQRDRILVIVGTGGSTITGDEIAAAAAVTPKLHWRVVGPVSFLIEGPSNLQFLGWVAEIEDEIASADIVIGSAGDGVVTAVLAAGRPFICLPQARPYGEQQCKSQRLSAVNAAISLDSWPAGGAWQGIFEKARNLNPENFRYLHDPQGPKNAAQFITRLASRS